MTAGTARAYPRSLISVEWSQGHHEPPPFGSLPHEPPRARWGVIISVLVVIVVIGGAILWLFTGWDDEGDPVVTDTAAEEAEEEAAEAEAETAEEGEAPGAAPATGTGTSAETETTAADTTGAATQPEATEAPPTTVVPPDADEYGPPQLSAGSPVSTAGLGAVTFGLTVAQAQRAAGTAMIALGPESDCYRVVAHRGPEGVTFLVHEGTIERVDIDSGPVTTRSGVGIGTSETTVTDLFGDKIQRQSRPDGSTDLIFVPVDASDRNYRVVFNVVDGAVRSFKSGKIPMALTETGCEG